MKKEKDTFTWVNKNEEKPVSKDGWTDLTPKPDMVNHPKHYKDFDIEVIEMMIRIWGKEKVASHCYITAFKYKMRAGSKIDALEDLRKSDWYLAKAKELSDGSK